MTIIAVANQKGGVGKSTTVLTVGHGLALRGIKTLIVDLDPQGHVARMLNLPKTPGVRRWYYDEEPIGECLVEARPNLTLLPTDKTLERVAGKMRSISEEGRNGPKDFSDTLRAQTRNFDAVLLDMAPSLSPMQVAALMAADYVIIPTRLRYADMDGVNEIIKSIQQLTQSGHKMGGFYVLPTFYDRSTNETPKRFNELVKAIGANRMLPPIVQDTKLSEAPGRGQTIYEYSENCNALVGYMNGGGKRVGGYNYLVTMVAGLVGK